MLRELYDSLTLDTLNQWVAERRQEGLHLDVKGVGPSLDRKGFAQCLSGFANSDGGLIVWGVDARKDESSVDAANGLVAIKNPGALLSELNSRTGEATTPIVDGVLHRIIHEDEQ